jgi:N-acetylneuraminic acid mutarotase
MKNRFSFNTHANLGDYRIVYSLMIVLLLSNSLCTGVNAVTEEPSKRLGQKMIYDPVNDRVILFGGSYYSGHYTFYGDTWSLDVESGTWTKLNTVGSPDGRFNIGMVYDSDNRKIVLFGGFSANDRIGDTWIYDIAANTWTAVTPQVSPPRRSDMGIAYNAGARKVVIFGGYGMGDRILDDTWAYDVEANTWTQMAPETHPIARYGGIMVYDSYTGKVLLFGGHMVGDAGDLGYENEVWAYEYESDSWERIPATNKPPARYWHDLAYDPDGHRIILFGGSQGGGVELGDTWIYSCEAKSWSKVASTGSPEPRSQPSMAYDASAKRTVMFGGADLKSPGDFLYYNDVWTLDANNQWSRLSTGTPSEPSGSSIPGFQPVTVMAGFTLAALMLVGARGRRAALRSSTPRGS